MSVNQVSDNSKMFVKFVKEAANWFEFPSCNDRSPNQPSVIIQPNVVSKLVDDIIGRAKSRALCDQFPEWDTQLENFVKNSKYSGDLALFTVIAYNMGWSAVFVTGKQVILNCKVSLVTSVPRKPPVNDFFPNI